MPASPRRPAFVVRRRIDLGQARLDDQLLGKLARILTADLLADAPTRPAAIVAAGAGDVQIDGQRHVVDDPLELAPGRYTVRLAGGDPFEVDLLPGELAVLKPTTAPETPTRGRRIAAWMAAGVSGASLLGAGIMGARLAGTQSDYERAGSGSALREFAARGDDEALSANIFLGVGLAAAITSVLLFWE